MARQKGIVKIDGTIGDVTFYKTQDGNLVREKGGVDGERIANDPAFIRTRENGKEFGGAAGAGKLLRDALRPLLMSASDEKLVSRLTRVMTRIKNEDSLSARGERNVAVGIASAKGKAALKNFNFNIRAVLGAVLFKPFSLDTSTGQLLINGLVPVNDLNFPPGATHVTITSSWARVDFASGDTEVQTSPPLNIPLDAVSSSISLVPPAVPSGSGTDVFVLHLAFFQEVNKIQYSLKNGSYNTMAVIEVV